MAIMNKVKVTICGTDYFLTTDEPAGAAREAAGRNGGGRRSRPNRDDRRTGREAAWADAAVSRRQRPSAP